jgi:hypothetical protein
MVCFDSEIEVIKNRPNFTKFRIFRQIIKAFLKFKHKENIKQKKTTTCIRVQIDQSIFAIRYMIKRFLLLQISKRGSFSKSEVSVVFQIFGHFKNSEFTQRPTLKR